MSHDLVNFSFENLGTETHWKKEGELLHRFNHLPHGSTQERASLLAQLFAQADEVIITPPLAIARGHLIRFGRKVLSITTPKSQPLPARPSPLAITPSLHPMFKFRPALTPLTRPSGNAGRIALRALRLVIMYGLGPVRLFVRV
nr:hypothetical protein [uncultured Deefgea sp.]